MVYYLCQAILWQFNMTCS